MPLQGQIDVDRGVQIRQISKFDDKNPAKFEPDPKYGGMTIYMYIDAPGVYYNVHGKAVSEAMASLAGFPVEKLAKQRRKVLAMEAFRTQMDEELRLEDGEEIVLAEQGDWKVIALPMERAKVVDVETGELVTAVPMPRKDALELLKLLNKTADDVNKAVEPETKGKDGKVVKVQA